MSKLFVYLFFLINLAAGPIPLSCEQANTINFIPVNDRWALVIGISEYKIKENNLEYAANDANAFSGILVDKCRLKKDHIKLLCNKEATRENIRKGIESWLRRNTTKDDKIIIFFSGHGTQDVDLNSEEKDGYDEFLVPYDFESDDISTAIRDKEFAVWIRNLASNNILLIFDSCYSGGAAKAKGFNYVKAKGQLNVQNFAKEVLLELPKKGIALLAACQDNQLSFESSEFKAGLFTHYFIDSLKNACDSNLDNIITVKEEFNCLKEKVEKYSKSIYGKEQSPILLNALKNEFELAYLPIIIEDKGNLDKAQIQNIYRQAISSRDNKRKIQLLEEICRMDPENSSYRNALADQYYTERIYDKALYNYDICLSLKYAFQDQIFLGMSKCYEALGNIMLAVDTAKKAISIKGDDYDNYNALARLYFIDKEYLESINAYNKSLELNSRQNAPYFELARINVLQNKYNEALKLVDRGIEINPDHGENYYLKGLIYQYELNDIEHANVLYNKCYEYDHLIKNIATNYNMYVESKYLRESELISSWEEDIKQLDPIVEKYIALIRINAEYLKRYEIANNYYDKLIYLYPFMKGKKEITKYLKK